jgi:acetylcholinesterase
MPGSHWIGENIAQFGGDATTITAWDGILGAIAVDWLGFAYPQDPTMNVTILDFATVLFRLRRVSTLTLQEATSIS